MVRKYGIISELHGINIKAVPATLELLKSKGVDALICNGDLFGERSGYNPQEYFATVLEVAGRSGLEAYIMPGSHETVLTFETVLKHFSKKYGNIVNTFENPRVDCNGHHLVFLPGSDWRAGEANEHGYSLEATNQTGIYQNEGGLLRVINMNDLKKLVSDPDKTIVFSHIPKKFDSPETGVDMAHFFQGRVYHLDAEDMSQWTFTEMSVIPGSVRKEAIEKQHRTKVFGLADSEDYILSEAIKIIQKEDVERWQVFVEKKENRGNENLGKIYYELGVRKNITGHFHESAGRATDVMGNIITPWTFSSELFYNASCLDRLMIGILTVNDEKVAYENINLQDYFK